MPACSISGDTAGGAISPSGYASFNGRVVVQGDAVASHAPCPIVPVHCAASTTASGHVTLNGIPITVAGDAATCGHSATGSSHVILS